LNIKGIGAKFLGMNNGPFQKRNFEKIFLIDKWVLPGQSSSPLPKYKNKS
jgi:hypothetical protein